MRSSPKVEDRAIELVMNWERQKGRVATDVRMKKLGYDILSVSDAERRCIEVKSRALERLRNVTMDGGLLKRLGRDVANYYLYLVRNVESNRATLRIVPPEIVIGNLETLSRLRFPINKATMKGIEEASLRES